MGPEGIGSFRAFLVAGKEWSKKSGSSSFNFPRRLRVKAYTKFRCATSECTTCTYASGCAWQVDGSRLGWLFAKPFATVANLRGGIDGSSSAVRAWRGVFGLSGLSTGEDRGASYPKLILPRWRIRIHALRIGAGPPAGAFAARQLVIRDQHSRQPAGGLQHSRRHVGRGRLDSGGAGAGRGRGKVPKRSVGGESPLGQRQHRGPE